MKPHPHHNLVLGRSSAVIPWFYAIADGPAIALKQIPVPLVPKTGNASTRAAIPLPETGVLRPIDIQSTHHI